MRAFEEGEETLSLFLPDGTKLSLYHVKIEVQRNENTILGYTLHGRLNFEDAGNLRATGIFPEIFLERRYPASNLELEISVEPTEELLARLNEKNIPDPEIFLKKEESQNTPVRKIENYTLNYWKVHEYHF
jgi:hypothetical protein